MNRPGKRVSAERVKPTRSGENYKTRIARVNKAEKIQLTVDEILFLDSLSARFKPPAVVPQLSVPCNHDNPVNGMQGPGTITLRTSTWINPLSPDGD